YRIHPDSWSVKRPDLMYEDYKVLLQRLRKSFPDLDSSYPKEMECFLKRMGVLEGNALWYLKQSREARQKFLSITVRHHHWKALAFWALTYLMGFDQCQRVKHKLKCLMLQYSRMGRVFSLRR